MNYETAVPIGSGGMGEVFKAWDAQLNRHVALKYLRFDDPEHVERLFREARAQASVDHPAICSVYEVGEDGGRPYIAMQYVDGPLLGDAAGELSLEQKILIVRQVADGVQAAHTAGLIHRDLKPSNIILDEDDEGRWRPHILDFGIAREHKVEGLTMTGQILGTPGYLSPEQARGEVGTLDRRTDIFSLGVILYELLTGRLPFMGDSQLAVLMNIIEKDPLPLRRLAPQVPRDLETVVLTCLEKDRDRRYPSARALGDDLDRYLRGVPVLATRPSRLYRLRRLVMRHRIAASFLLVAVLAAVGGTVKYTIDLERERSVAEAASDDAEALVGFMLDDLYQSLEPLGRLDLLESVAREAAAHYDRFPEGRLATGQRVRRAVVMRNLADVVDAQGHVEEAVQRNRRAAAILAGPVTRPDAPAQWRAELATTRSQVAEGLQELGDLDGCRAELDSGLVVARSLVAEHPEDPQWVRVLVELLGNVGWVLREQGDPEGAVARLQEARSLVAAMVAAYPDDPSWVFRQAELDSYEARAHQEEGEFVDALVHLESARGRLLRLAAAEPGNTRWQFELMLTAGRLGWLAEDRGDRDAAMVAYREGLERGRSLVRRDPANAHWERELAVMHSSIGALQLADGDPRQARDSFASGLEISERLVSRSPDSASAVNDLAWDWLQLGAAEELLDDTDAARRACERALELIRPVTDRVREVWYLDTLAIALLRLARVEEARPVVAELLAVGWDEPDFLELCRHHGLLP